jgi:hypothetical protein
VQVSRKPEFDVIYHLSTGQVNQIETQLGFLDNLDSVGDGDYGDYGAVDASPGASNRARMA